VTLTRREILTLIAAAGLANTALAKPAGAAWPFASARRLPLLIGGSSTMLHFTNALVEGFTKAHKDVDVVVTGGGSAPGLMALKRGAIDLAAMSKDLTTAEDDIGIYNFLIARDAIGVVVNPANPVRGLTGPQATALFEGKITNWRDVGGTDAPVTVIVRPPKATTAIAADALILGGADITNEAVTVQDSKDMIGAIKANPNAIGYLTLRRFTPDVKVLAINGIKIRRETILTGRYPFTRSFYYVLDSNGPPSALQFAAFVIGPQGRDILAGIDLVPTF
jgi:phosphate transport system substrate-binding protein